MSPTSRRIFRYWLLLLVPALLVGGGAIGLLQREQDRMVEQSASVEESRRNAISARARLLAENVELFAGDVEAGLLDALASAPANGLDSLLSQWERDNPLVLIAFRARSDGQLLRPAPDATGGEARRFVQRYARTWSRQPPWGPSPPAAASPEARPAATREEDEARKSILANVVPVQSARRDVRELLRSRDYPAQGTAAADAAVVAGATATARSSAESGTVMKAEANSFADAATGRSLAVAPAPGTSRPAAGFQAADTTAVAKASGAADRRGWAALRVADRPHVIGWVQPSGDAEVRGVEIDLEAVLDRLAGVLPAEFEAGEGYALRDELGRPVHQVGFVPRDGLAMARLPLTTGVLRGWEVAAFSAMSPSFGGHGFFWPGVLVVAVFVLSIVAGGSLLVRQARQSEEEAAQKTSFVANVSHEFKTPLTTIRLYAELLEQGRVRDRRQEDEYLRTIGRETQRLARLVNNALDFSRLEQGRKQYAREALDVGTELTRLLDTHAPRVAESGLILKRELPIGPVPAVADRDALGQIVLNLIDNACKYAAEGGEITVSVTAMPGGAVEVRIADRGPGVPAGQSERIFEKFHRVDEALTAEKSGVGLGLSIARQLARGMGGGLFHRPRPGGGAEFILSIP